MSDGRGRGAEVAHQPLAQERPRAVEARLHGCRLESEAVRGLLRIQALDFAEHVDAAEGFRQRIDRRLQQERELAAGAVRSDPDLVTPKLAPLQLYQLALRAPAPPPGSFDAAAARRGRAVFEGRGQCAVCHVPPIYTEPGHNLHAPEEIGIDDFQTQRSPTGGYRTAPLAGLWTHGKGGYYHDGRFATLREVVDHYDARFDLGLGDGEKRDLIEFLKSL